ncbi:capsule biosynthesis protein [Taibaiella lutea]|uniref:Capsule biosynthesis protein n=1 Tax=Taibaiella lutea TaxID=2608001 RepID=A0A5M6CK89_9BACT|nr:SLBB domain-containing protein [Taibaiella lutea]KAA5533755.1 capsule biosynthesis protein [Taibaiella lutea]
MPNRIVKYFSKALSVLVLTMGPYFATAQQPQPKTQTPTTVPTIDPSTVTPEQIKEIMDQNKDQADQKQDNNSDQQQDQNNTQKTTEVEKTRKENRGINIETGLPIFGNEIFNNNASTFAPEANRPVPSNYVLGPGDKIVVNVTGNSVVSFNTIVTPDGSVSLREFGKVFVAGRTIENATTIIKEKLKANRFAVDNGTNVDVTITNIRTIHIHIIGQVRTPGDYDVSSLTTVFNALYQSGGITNNGTFRAVRVIRNNEQIAQIDIYDYLLKGDLSNNITLRDGDIVQVKEYNVRVSMEGEVKRPAYFEVLPGETLSDVIRFAGGFTDLAYKFSIKAIQLTDRQQRIKDIPRTEFESYTPLKGDKYTVSRILNKVENRVSIAGAVYRPGDFELTDGLTLRELILKADGLKEDAYLERGYITRQKEDNSAEVIPFYVKGIMDGTDPDILLKKEDQIQLSSLFDYTDAYTVSIAGKVRVAGTFPFHSGMTVEDLILSGGGFADGANMMEVEIARRVKDSDKQKKDAKLSTVIKVLIDPELKLADSKFKLEPFDVVSVFALPGYVKPQFVTIEGEVMNPGTFALITKNDRISDVINRANGFTAFANLKGASLKRHDLIETQSDAEQQEYKKQLLLQRQKEEIADTSMLNGLINNQTKRNDFVGINLPEIMEKPKGKKDLIVLDGDVINVPRTLQTVKVTGEVYSPKTIVYTNGKSLREYISRSGGFTEDAKASDAYVLYANGDTKSTRSFLFFRNYPNIEPGAEIFIPRRKPRKERDGASVAQTWVGLTASMASVAAIIYAIVNANK